MSRPLLSKMNPHRIRPAIVPICLFLFALTCTRISAGDEPLHAMIDRLIAVETPDYEKIAAPLCSDEEFLRRITLDLTGMIPATADARRFLADTDSNRREKLIDDLLASPAYARHMQRVFDVILMRRLPQKNVPVAEWEKFLRESFAENKPWDRLAREILTADGADPARRGPARFYLDRNGEVNEITRDVARLFLGANLECAQCHDHPLIKDFEQQHYYGISAFFIRSAVMTDKEQRVVFGEKAEGEVTFESAFEIRDKVSKGPKSTLPRLFDGMSITEPKFEKIEDAYVKEQTPRPVPRFSRRNKFAEFVASAENRRFCRTAANRLWALMFGRGLVHPIANDHSKNPPSHPLLMAMLTEQVAQQRFDIKKVLRGIALSRTYQRSSRRETSDNHDPRPDDARFAQALLKPLSPSQLAWSVLVATGETELRRQALGEKFTEDALGEDLKAHEERFVQLYGGEPGFPSDAFESTLNQVLFLANDPMIAEILKPKGGNLADRLLQLSADNPQQIADELFVSALTRPATADDVREVAEFLNGLTGDERSLAVQDLIWGVISSSEFRFNH